MRGFFPFGQLRVRMTSKRKGNDTSNDRSVEPTHRKCAVDGAPALSWLEKVELVFLYQLVSG